MKVHALALVGLYAALAHAGEMKMCSETNMNGHCDVQTSAGSRTGTWRSYHWASSLNTCVKVCNDCTELGWRCKDYSNNDISFSRIVIFDWAGGSGPDRTSCC
ncbi:hypothetical protein GQ42DRAFT_38625 [Ramicandelaber brevisporus]|nr:hypothetical protein GQ42DRAFT_38625 [Ramicandelaber brevisporus]